jgi:hypothetical protein
MGNKFTTKIFYLLVIDAIYLATGYLLCTYSTSLFWQLIGIIIGILSIVITMTVTFKLIDYLID